MKKILSILAMGLMLLTLSCTSENEMIDGDDTNSELTESGKTNIYLDLNVANVTTKATETVESAGTNNTVAQTVTDCSLIIADANGKVLYAKDNVAVAADGSISDYYYFKIADTGTTKFNVMVVANSTVTFANVTTLDAANAKVQFDETLAADDLVKVGTKEVSVDASKGTKTAARVDANTTTVTIPVKQLTACVRLAGFDVTYSGKSQQVVITGVKLNNVNPSEKTDGTEVAITGNAKTSTWTIDAAGITVYDGTNAVALSTLPTFFSFQNTSATKTSLTINFKMGDQAYEKTYTIKNPAVDTADPVEAVYSGTLYNVYVKMAVTNSKVDVKFVTYTTDWVEGGIIEGTLVKE